VNRHAWREVKRQIRESGSGGLVAFLLVGIATSLAGGLWAMKGWVDTRLLPGHRGATVVAVTSTPDAGPRLWTRLRERFPTVRGRPVAPGGVRDLLGQWFPEYASLFASLDDTSFPTLLDLEVPHAIEDAVTEWLKNDPEVAAVESSRSWQDRLERASYRLVWAGMFVSCILLAACSILVLLVVRLLVLDHTDEIAIMRLIGARERDIRLPYLASGTIIGLGGGALGGVALATGSVWGSSILPGLAMPPQLLAALLLAGAAAGCLGAIMGLAGLPEGP
jgi:cell division transport system permease protein